MDAEADSTRRELRGRAVEEHGLFEHDDPVEVGRDRAQLVGDQQHRRLMLIDEMNERVAEQPLRLGVNSRDRLVENQQFGIGDEGAGDERALLLSAGELGDEAVAEFGECDCSEGVVDGFAIGRGRWAPPCSTREPTAGDDFSHRRGQLGRESTALGYVPEPPGLIEFARRPTEEFDSAGRRAQQPEQESEQRGFPRAVRADEGYELARPKREPDIGHDEVVVVGEREVVGGEDRGWRNESDSQYYPGRCWESFSEGTRRMRTLVRRSMSGFVAMVLIGACASGGGSTASRTPSAVAAFFPIAATLRALAGPQLAVRDLTPPGVEPHDLELTTAEADAILDARLVVVMGKGFQPAVERAARGRDSGTVFVLDRLHSGSDPHVWLDPVTMGRVVGLVATTLQRELPAQRSDIGRRTKRVQRALANLDRDFRTGLAHCDRTVIVTAHEAFGRLAAQYGLRQEAIAGFSPEQEPDPRRLSDLADLVQREHVTTIFTEALVSPRVAQTLAREVGVTTAVLDPIESPPRGVKRFGGYLAAMHRNLKALRAALGCR